MKYPIEIERKISEYISAVTTQLQHRFVEERNEVLLNLRSDIHEALQRRGLSTPTVDDLNAVLAQMDPPEAYGYVDPNPELLSLGSPLQPCVVGVGSITTPITPRERWLKALPMVLCFVLLAAVAHIGSACNLMFKEMDLGPLPVITQYALALSNGLCVALLMLLTGLIYLKWVGQDRRRLFRFNVTMFAVSLFLVFSSVVSFFLPLVSTMNEIGHQ